jgi:hypothetical protein
VPTDLRTANGTCTVIGVQFYDTYSVCRLAVGAGAQSRSATAEFGQWLPPTISNVPAGVLMLLPTYTAMGNVPSRLIHYAHHDWERSNSDANASGTGGSMRAIRRRA